MTIQINLLKNWALPIVLGIALIIAGPKLIEFLSIVSLKVYYGSIGHPINLDPATSGQIGDTFGGTTGPFIALFAGYLTFIAFWAQILANRDVQKQFSVQQFESQFFEMIRLHRENVSEMKITGYIMLRSEYKEKVGDKFEVKSITEAKAERIVDGRKAFVSMVKEMRACYEICELQQKKFSVPDDKMFKIAYRLFFFGSFSHLSLDEEYPEFVKAVRIKLERVRMAHKTSVGLKNEISGLNNKTINLHIKYAPFTGHESRLGHYYRHLFSAVKFVVEKENSGLFGYKQSRDYLKILRIQLSNDEQMLLYYNYLSGIGYPWESDENSFLLKYRMLHNLPIGRLKIVPPPKIVFAEQIRAFKKKGGGKQDLFEWEDD